MSSFFCIVITLMCPRCFPPIKGGRSFRLFFCSLCFASLLTPPMPAGSECRGTPSGVWRAGERDARLPIPQGISVRPKVGRDRYGLFFRRTASTLNDVFCICRRVRCGLICVAFGVSARDPFVYISAGIVCGGVGMALRLVKSFVALPQLAVDRSLASLESVLGRGRDFR